VRSGSRRPTTSPSRCTAPRRAAAPSTCARARACSSDAEPDWREWTDQQEKKREAVTFRARQVVFESGRPAAAAGSDAGKQNGAGPEPAISADREPAGVGSASDAGAASADDLPF
jgi:hypothetical protein